MVLPFVKMEGLGNCYIFVEAHKTAKRDLRRLAIAMSDIGTGIGADGLITITTNKEPFRMRIFNRDGSEAEMCGNGLRQAAMFLKRIRYHNRRKFIVATSAGKYQTEIISSGGNRARVKSSLGPPDFSARSVGLKTKNELAFNIRLFKTQKRLFIADFVRVGNPHAVIRVSDFDFDWIKVGRNISEYHRLSHGANVHFYVIENSRRFRMKIYERGSAATRACGTGAAACLAAGVLRKLLNK